MSRPPGNGYRNMSSNGSTPSMASGTQREHAMQSQQRLATPIQHQRPISPGGSGASASMSRAERFEDEKRRIIESAFSKLDANGQLAESYITHIRIQEDSQYPSSPPPPDSAEGNKKPRLIIIAVRSTGRVRMHKARENNNGSFSIGKTWNLEELSAIETFSSTAAPAANEREAQQRAWAGSVGFTVTIAKPYYWQAGTSKEKDFFIASAVKIYRKYTKGQVPELKGFDEREKSTMLGTPAASAAASNTQLPQQQQAQPRSASRQAGQDGLSPGMRAESRDMSPGIAPPQPPFAQRPQSREGSRYRQSPGPPPDIHDAQRPGSAATTRQQSESPAPSRFAPPPAVRQREASPALSAPRTFASQEHMRAPSREAYRDGQRPGTSPGPRWDGRSPSSQAQQQSLQNSIAPSTRSQSPGGSSLASSAGPGRPQVRQQSPPRSQPRQWQEPEQNVAPPEHAQTNGAGPGGPTGASLFAATRQRWMANNQQPPQEQSQPQPQHQRPQSPPQLPPIETQTTPRPDQNQQTPDMWHPPTAASEASSAGIDLGDAAAIGALTSYWGPEPTSAPTVAPATPIIQEPSSPPTPERSARRPQFADRNHSEASFDLRPPPLKSGGARTPEDVSDYATPQESRSIISAGPTSAAQTPRLEEPPEIKPLTVNKRQSQEQRPTSSRRSDPDEKKLAMPGAFSNSPLGPSPLGTPAETPAADPIASAPVTTPQPAPQPQQRQVEKEAERQIEDEQPKEDAANHRPGLGPMIKKNAVRDRFKKAATAANAFKPRPGGAAEKILRAKAEREAGLTNGDQDGVSGFVPRPGAPGRVDSDMSVRSDAKEVPAVAAAATESAREVSQPRETTPKVEVFSPTSPLADPFDSSKDVKGVELRDDQEAEHLKTLEQDAQLAAEEQAERDLFEQREARKPQVKVKRRSQHQQRNLAALGIDAALLEGKALDFEVTLVDFGWQDSALEPKKLAELEADLRREQGRLEAGSWLSHTDAQKDDKVAQVESLLDKAISECDDLEGLLTLYSVELGSLNDDIAFIEAQSQGLQVQSANQKALLRELEGLVDTMSLDRKTLEPLRSGDLTDAAGLGYVEASVSKLYQALVTIDPSIRSGVVSGRAKSRSGIDGDSVSEVSSMRALREKKQVYEREATAFVQRLVHELDGTFADALGGAKNRVMRPSSGGAKRLNKDVFSEVRNGLWMYGPLLLFAKELDQPAWNMMLRLYHEKAQILYSDAFKENVAGWKRAARRPGADEEALLFTSLEKDEASGAAGMNAARKLTIKRSQTLAKTLRSASGGNKSPTESRHPGQMMSSESFAGALDEMAPLISQEQNFVVELFHATSLESADFLDSVNAASPEQRRGTNLLQPRPTEPDREMAKRVTGVMDGVFGFFAQETGTALEWAVKEDPIQGVGVMACLSRHAFYLQESNQEFLLQLIENLSSHLQNLWSKFVDQQVRAIEDTKVKIKKRKGVIGFIKIFPHFAAAVENVFSAVARDDYERPADCMFEVRRLVDETYSRINRAMFDSLKVIAKESPTAPSQQPRTGEDPEDKEMLNYHILLIENMNHYIEEVDDGDKQGVLAEWKGKAILERVEALDGYVSRVMKRPLGKLLDFLDSIESLLPGHPNPTAIASRPTFSRKAARNTFSQYDAKEIRRGIDTLRKRIEKHFGDADEEVLSRNLVGFVCKECERAYERTIERMERIVGQVYPPTEGEKPVEVDFSREDVRAGFRR